MSNHTNVRLQIWINPIQIFLVTNEINIDTVKWSLYSTFIKINHATLYKAHIVNSKRFISVKTEGLSY